MKKFFQDFKAFISRGNIIDMAVGVIIGSAFSTIVTALTDKIIKPLINYLLSLGGENGLEKAYLFLKRVYTAGELDLEKSIYIDWGAFITAIINFLLVAFVLFIILRAVMKANSLFKETVSGMTNEEKKALRKQAKQIAKTENRKYKEVYKEVEAENTKQKEEAKKQAEEEEKRKAEEERLLHPTTEDLLLQIRDLLKENSELKATAKTSKSTKKESK